MSKETIQAEINLLHKQLEAKQLELDAKYAERNALKPIFKDAVRLEDWIPNIT